MNKFEGELGLEKITQTKNHEWHEFCRVDVNNTKAIIKYLKEGYKIEGYYPPQRLYFSKVEDPNEWKVDSMAMEEFLDKYKK